MFKSPLVSIIIPVYNRADLIGETLDSIIAQTYQNWECIVVDDGSTDNTSEVLQKYVESDSRISYYQRPNKYKPGGNGARNYGFDISKGAYVNWFDSDDVMLANYISLAISKIINYNLDYIIINNNYFDNENNIIENPKKLEVNGKLIENYITGKTRVLIGNIILNRVFLNSRNLKFNEVLKAAQEWELFCKIFSYDAKYDFIEQHLILIRKHTNNISLNSNFSNTRNYNYLIARRIVRDFLIAENQYTFVIQNQFNETSKKYIIELLRYKKYQIINKAIFYNGFTVNNILCFINIYFFIITKRGKSKLKCI